MKKELHRAFNEEINRHRNALVFAARKCEWKTFQSMAGRLFDYLELVEMEQIERHFFRISRIVVIALVIAVFFIWKIDVDVLPVSANVKKFLLLAAIGGCSFELYFYLNFRMYMDRKASLYKKRKERFIRNMEKDFRDVMPDANP